MQRRMRGHRSAARVAKAVAAIAAVSVVAAAGPVLGATTSATYTLSPTVKLKTQRMDTGPEEVRVLKLAPGSFPDIQPARASFPLTAKTSAMGVAAGALGAVNGDFGTKQDQPIHTLMIDGELWTTGLHAGVAMAWSADGTQAYVGAPDLRIAATKGTTKLFSIASWNANQSAGAVSAYTSRGGTLAKPPGKASPTSSDPHWCAASLVPTNGLGWGSSTHEAIVRQYTVATQPEPCPQTPLALSSTAGAVVVAQRFTSGTPNAVQSLTVGDTLKISWKFVGWPADEHQLV
jgi:hypothetical protein